jgi:uncharacterized protein YeaO (DUF488 family)
MDIRTKRIYEQPESKDGIRILVDRLWPRGLSREQAQLDAWYKDLAPSTELRRWYNHDPGKWDEFRSRYFLELRSQPEQVRKLLKSLGKSPVTLLFGAKEAQYNNAVALKEYLESRD